MWTKVFFALLVASASAEYGWKPNSEYRYEVHSKTLASLNQVADLYTGVLMRAQVVITPKTPDHLIVEIPQAEYSQVQATLPQGTESHIPQEHLKYQTLPLTKQPFEVKLKQGVFASITVSKEVPIWEVNVIKSIVSQLQVDTQGQQLIPSKLNMVPRDENQVTAVYKTMEDTVEGECEVLYDITPLPKYVLQRMPHLVPQPQLVGHGQFIDIVKTKNFTNCVHRPEFHFGFTGLTQWEPTANKMGNFLARSSVSRVVISGNLKSYTIQSSVTTNKVIISPEIYNHQKGEVYSRVNLTLSSVHSSQGQHEECKNPQTVSKLVYDFNSPWTSDEEARQKWHQRSGASTRNTITGKGQGSSSSESDESISTEEWHQEMPTMTHAPASPFLPYFVGYKGHSIQHAKNVNVNQIVKQLCQEIGQQLKEPGHVSEKNTLDRFTMLTRVVQTMNVKQLQQITQELYVKTEIESETPVDERTSAWTVYRDAVVQSGTGPAFTIIKEWILNKQIEGEQAAQVMASLPKAVAYPTVEYMKNFFELVRNQQVVSQEYLNTSIIFSFTTLVRMAQVDRNTIHNRYPVHTFGRLTPKDDAVVAQEFIPYFAQQLEHAIQEQDSQKIQVYIRALGNMAHPKIVRVFEPYLEGKKPMTDYQRTLVVVSLLKLTQTHPRLARSVLYKTYANIGEVYQVRVAAVYNLMKTNPPADMLQRMAQFTHEDPSYQVSAAVKSVIKSYATLIGKEERENAQSAVNMLTPKEFGIQYSHSNVTDYIVKGLNLGYSQYLNHIGSRDTLIPESLFYQLTRNVNGYKYISNKFSTMISSVTVLRDLLDDMVQIGEKTEQGTSKTGTLSQTLEKIYKTLNVEGEFNKQLEGNVIFEWLGANRLVTFDNHTIENTLEKIVTLLQRCQNKRNFNLQKLYNEISITVGMPTCSGFPFVYTLNTPTVASIRTGVKIQPTLQKGQTGIVVPTKVGVEADLTVHYSTRIQSKISFITPFDHQHYIAGVDRNFQFYLPVKTKFGLDLTNKRIKVQIKPLNENQKYNVMHYSSWPYVSSHDILEFKPVAEGGNTRRIQLREPIKFDEKIGEQTGLVFLVKGFTEKRFFDFKTLYNYIESHNMQSVFVYPTKDYTIQHSILDVVYDPQVSKCDTITLTAAYTTGKEHEQTTQTETSTGNLAKTSNKEYNAPERLGEFLAKVKTGIKEAEPIVIDFGLEMKGQNTAQYVATVAYASSPVDEQTKILTYLRKLENNQNYEICLTGLGKTKITPKGNAQKAIEIDPKAATHVLISFGEQCQDTPQVEIVGKFQRTPERKNYIEKLPAYTDAQKAASKGMLLEPAQRKIVQEAKVLDNYHFTMKYQQVPEQVKGVVYKIYTTLRHALYYYVSETPFDGQTQEGQVEAVVQFAPDLKAVSTYLHTPVGGINFQNVRTSPYVAKIVNPGRAKEALRALDDALFEGKYLTACNIDNTHIRTFSNQSYPVQMGKVWHVAMVNKPQYTTRNGQVTYFGTQKPATALVRDIENGQKELKLLLDVQQETVTVDVLPEQGGKVLVVVNGEKIPATTEKVYRYQKEGTTGKKTIVKFYQLPTGEVILKAPLHGVKVLYLQQSIRINLEPTNMQKTVGLCGARGYGIFDMTTPQGYITKTPEQFTATWALSEEGRIGELKKAATEYSKYKRNVLFGNVVSEQDAGRADFLGRTYQNLPTSAQDYDSSSSSESNESKGYEGGLRRQKSTAGSVGCNVNRIISIEKDGKHCFSLYPQTTCTIQCRPEETETKTTQFYCVDKSNTSEHWQKMIARGANPDFRNKGNAQEIEYEAPIKCTRN